MYDDFEEQLYRHSQRHSQDLWQFSRDEDYEQFMHGEDSKEASLPGDCNPPQGLKFDPRYLEFEEKSSEDGYDLE